jgi:DNA uptake protein ComE-like DNA-binding protein
MADVPDKPAFVWTPSQRGVLIALVLILSSVLLVLLARDRMYVSNPPPPRAQRYDELADRIDPNAATWQELAVLPQVGEKRAKEIVAYRDAFVGRQPDGVAFGRPQDLLEVKGIGPALLETLRPHLMFPSTHPTTNSSR